MTTFLIVTGAFVWLVFGLLVALRLMKHRRVANFLPSPRIMPYASCAWYRGLGWIGATTAKLRLSKVPKEIIDAHRAITLADMEHLRDVLVEVDRLPTVTAGKAALHLDSMFGMRDKQVH